MQNSVARKWQTIERYQTPPALVRMIWFRSSVWAWAREGAKKIVAAESLAEGVLVVATFSLVGGLFFGLYQALQNYPIMGWP